MFNLLIGPITSLLGDTVKGFVDTKKAKAELALTEIKATQKLKEDQIAGKVAWEASAVDQMKGSWKDEVSFVALQDLPSYYHNLLYIAISASFGIKGAQGAAKLFKRK